jgi:sugar phosphate isomerase/epimerase
MKSFSNQSRKEFIRRLAVMAGAAAFPGSVVAAGDSKPGDNMKIGLVTYLWAKDWDVPTIIKNCTEAKIKGVELRVDHAHGVGLDLTKAERRDVKKQFKDSPVTVVGMGTNQDYHHPDQEKLKASIEKTKQWLQLSKDIGGSGVKVKPNALPDGVPKEKTLEQIGNALNELGKYALDMGQEIRLEVHGRETQLLPNIAEIMEHVHNDGSTVCWNSNSQDLEGRGLEYNFNLVKDDFGDICHVREFNVGDYPYQQLMDLFVEMNYDGWILLECRTDPEDKVEALKEQRRIWEKMVASSQSRL